MKSFRKGVLLTVLAAFAASALAGCGQLRSETGTGSQTRTTEAPVIMVTERVTEAPQTETEAPQTETQPPQTETQPETQAPQTETQPQTQPQTTALSADEEAAQETRYDQARTMWASDDINVRESPTTSEDNIFASLDQGQTASVVGETPNWYVVSIPYTDDDGNPQENTGYVSKQFMSETEVQPKTEEERAAAVASSGETASSGQTDNTAGADQSAAEQTAAQDTAAGTSAASASTSSASGGTTVTMAADANIRADASQTSDVVGVVSAGQSVTVIGDADGWYQVDYNGVQGYVNKNLVG